MHFNINNGANLPDAIYIDQNGIVLDGYGTKIHTSSTVPTGTYEGQIYYNTADDNIYRYNGSTWLSSLGSSGSSGTSGSSGSSGTSGNSGSSGTSGSSGSSGSSGTSGTSVTITASNTNVIYKDGSGNLVGSNDFYYDGVSLKVKGNLESIYTNGDEGGEIFLNKATTNTTLTSGVTIDVNQNRLRIFETGGTNRGGYWDITALGAGVSTNLLSSGTGGGAGSSGTAGSSGSSGTSGSSGSSGTSGSSGSSGTSGSSGSSGTAGSSGSAGTSGLLTLTGTTNNGIITLDGTQPNATVESNLTFDGNTLVAAANATSVPLIIASGSTSDDMVRITQTGTGNAFVVEDSANPDATPFIVHTTGFVGVGTASPGNNLHVQGSMKLTGTFSGNNTNFVQSELITQTVLLYMSNNT